MRRLALFILAIGLGSVGCASKSSRHSDAVDRDDSLRQQDDAGVQRNYTAPGELRRRPYVKSSDD